MFFKLIVFQGRVAATSLAPTAERAEIEQASYCTGCNKSGTQLGLHFITPFFSPFLSPVAFNLVSQLQKS